MIANLGDVNPFDYDGFFIFIDEKNEYQPEAALLQAENPNDENTTYTVYRFSLEKCTYQNEILSDNNFHPEISAWWAKSEKERQDRPQDRTYLKNVADYADYPEEQMIADFCSDDPIKRAEAYRAIGEYHGFDNFDSYPLTGLSRKEVEKMYKEQLDSLYK